VFVSMCLVFYFKRARGEGGPPGGGGGGGGGPPTPEVLPTAADGGVLVPSRDPARLAAAITSLERDPAMRVSIAAAGRRRLESTFTIDRMVADYMRTYRRLLG
jgi:glycosyltransferase involved in cell wall biosynthesis